MGQAATREVGASRDEAGPAVIASSASVAATATVSPRLPSAASPGDNGSSSSGSGGENEDSLSDEDNMAASSAAVPCRVSLRQSIAKMRWTASSLESLKSAEDRLLVSCSGSSSAVTCVVLRAALLSEWTKIMLEVVEFRIREIDASRS